MSHDPLYPRHASSPLSSEKEQPVLNGKAAGSSPAGGSIIPPSGTWQYIVVRKELSGGALLAQVAHAAGNSVDGALPLDTRVVILTATKEQMAKAVADIDAAKISFFRMDESDGPLAGVTTALGVVTNDKERLKPILGHLRPWRAKD